jgi:hypothetical protein
MTATDSGKKHPSADRFWSNARGVLSSIRYSPRSELGRLAPERAVTAARLSRRHQFP